MRKIRRLVFLFAGFETHAAEEQRARFAHGAEKTGPLWNSKFAVGALRPGEHGCHEFQVSASGAGWGAETDIVICDWSDLLVKVQNQNPVWRFASGVWALSSFALNRTLYRYVRTSWRYGLFFLYPCFLMFIALSPLMLVFAGGGMAAAGVLLSAGLALLFIKKFHLMTMLDNWSFTRSAALERNPGIEAKLALFKSTIQSRVDAFHAEAADGEVLIAAHSLGAHFAVKALGGALGGMKQGRPAPGLLLAGSSLLKIALHPKAARLREAAVGIARSDAQWLDAQSQTDLLNFYRTDPVRVLGLPAKRQPMLMFVRFRAMLTPETYSRIKMNWLRVHRQFVLAAERRTNYSWHMMLAGPVRFAEILEHRGLPQDFVATAEIREPVS